MKDKQFENIQQIIRNLAKEMVIATLGMIDDEKLNPEVQYGWIRNIQEASDEEMPGVLDSIKYELQMIGVDNKVLH